MSRYQAFRQKYPWTARFFLFLLIMVIILSVIRASLPYAIKYSATSWLESQGVTISINEIDMSLLDASFVVNDISGKNKVGQGFSVNRFGIVWQWKPLFNRLLVIDQLQMSGFSIDVKTFENGDMNIAGLEIRKKDNASKVESDNIPEPAPWDIIVKNISLSDIGFCLETVTDTHNTVLDYCADMGLFKWVGSIRFTPSGQESDSDVPLYADGNLSIKKVSLLNNKLERYLLNLTSLDFNKINVDTLNDINIENIDVQNLSMLQRHKTPQTDDSQVFSFDQLDIQSLGLEKQNRLNIGVIKLSGSSAYFVIKKDGTTELAEWFPKQSGIKPEVDNKISKTKSQLFHYSFKAFHFNTKKYMKFIDDRLKEPFATDIHHIKLKFSQLDSQSPEKLSHLSLDFGMNKHGRFELNADVNPLSMRPSLKGKGEISGFDLRVLAPLTKQHVGHNVKSGQLDVDLKLDIDKGIIDSNMKLILHQFELKTLDKKEAEALNSEFGFPLSSSLSLIRDSDNTIRLDIPVTGDIDNPEFDPRDAIIKASSKAITTAVIHYYTPFGLVFATGALLDLATALKFEPIIFSSGKSELLAAHTKSLDKLVSLMTDRPGVHLTLCGMSNVEDKNILFPDDVNKVEANKQKSATTVITKEKLTRLKNLAESRSSLIKNYLVKSKAIKASRLIECSPEYDEENISGVEIKI